MGNRLIPFKLLPASWGLKGIEFEKARINYEYDSDHYLRDTELAKLIPNKKEKALALLEVRYNHDRISEEDYLYEKLRLEFDEDSLEYKEAKLALDFKYHKIDKRDYDYELAEARGEPYVNIINFEINPNNPNGNTGFELDWNDKWIEVLRNNGYSGATDELVIQQWFDAVCRSVGSEEGFDNFEPEIKMTRKFKDENGKTTFI